MYELSNLPEVHSVYHTAYEKDKAKSAAQLKPGYSYAKGAEVRSADNAGRRAVRAWAKQHGIKIVK